LRAAFLDEVAILIQDSAMPGHDSAPALGLGFERLDPGKYVDRITEDDWPMKPPLEDREKRERIDGGCVADQARGNGETEQTVGHRLAENAATHGGMIDVQWIEISGKAGEHDDFGLRDGSPWAFPLFTDFEIIERHDRP
jgi:hypothetical protein